MLNNKGGYGGKDQTAQSGAHSQDRKRPGKLAGKPFGNDHKGRNVKHGAHTDRDQNTINQIETEQGINKRHQTETQSGHQAPGEDNFAGTVSVHGPSDNRTGYATLDTP